MGNSLGVTGFAKCWRVGYGTERMNGMLCIGLARKIVFCSKQIIDYKLLGFLCGALWPTILFCLP